MQMRTVDSEDEILSAMRRMFDPDNRLGQGSVRGVRRCSRSSPPAERRWLTAAATFRASSWQSSCEGCVASVALAVCTLVCARPCTDPCVRDSYQLEEDVTDAELKEIQDEVDVGGGMIDYVCVGCGYPTPACV